jgi:hypothetical protein
MQSIYYRALWSLRKEKVFPYYYYYRSLSSRSFRFGREDRGKHTPGEVLSPFLFIFEASYKNASIRALGAFAKVLFFSFLFFPFFS